ncbi:MAG: hypothetical protein ACAH11_13770 [Sphingomonas sp.]
MIASMLALAIAGGPVSAAPCVTPPNTAKGAAAGQPWFVNGAEITFNGRQFRKFGLPRVLMPGEIRLAGAFKGVAVYLPSDTTFGEGVVYLPVDWAACSFQPYAAKG